MSIEEKAKAYDEALWQAKKELDVCGSLDCDAARQIFRFFPELRKEEKPLTPFQQCLNCILRGVYYAEVPDKKVNEFILNVVRTRTDELIKLAKKHEYTDCQLNKSKNEEIRQQLLWLCDEWEHNPERRTIPADISNIRKIRNWLEKQKESLHISESCKENADSFTIEEERIRKALIDALKVSETIGELKFRLPYPTREECIAYLEKQKEQKSLNISAASEWLRNHVCHYMNSEYNEFHKCVEYDGSIDKERLINDFEEAMQKEQKPVDFPTTDEEVNEFLETHPKVEVPEKYKTPDFVFKKQEYESYPIISKDTTSVKPTEWSKEDEEMWMDIKSQMIHGSFIPFDKIEWIENQLKPLRPVSKESLQPHWKPSEEQMDALKELIDDANRAGWVTPGATELYEQLKKL